MSTRTNLASASAPQPARHADPELDERVRATQDAVDAAVLAPSVHGSRPWTIVLHGDRLELRADRSRQLMALDPSGRELVLSLGAALFNARVALSARGWAVQTDRFSRPDEPDLAAVVRPVPGAPEARLPLLADALHRRRTHRTGFLAEEVPDELLDYLSAAAAAEDSVLVAVRAGVHRRLLAHLTREADAVQYGDPACRADLRRWGPQPPIPRPPTQVADPHPESARRTVDSNSGEDRTFLLITSRTDDPIAWLRSGEALERVLLELTVLGWRASPMTQVLEVPATRARLRADVTRELYPQMLLRIGFAGPRSDDRNRCRGDVTSFSGRRLSPRDAEEDSRLAGGGTDVPSSADPVAHRSVSDGRGGTTWT
jgi:nitroreductase